jgi:hypothetical protein
MSHSPHAPAHHFETGDTFFITGATIYKQHFSKTASALDALEQLLLAKAKHFDCCRPGAFCRIITTWWSGAKPASASAQCWRACT